METNKNDESLSLSIYDILSITFAQKRLFLILSTVVLLVGSLLSILIPQKREITKQFTLQLPRLVTASNVLPFFFQSLDFPKEFETPSISFSVIDPGDFEPKIVCTYFISGKYNSTENEKFWSDKITPVYQIALLKQLLLNYVAWPVSEDRSAINRTLSSSKARLQKYKEYRQLNGSAPGLPITVDPNANLSWINIDIVIAHLERQVIDLEINKRLFEENYSNFLLYEPVLHYFDIPKEKFKLSDLASTISNIPDPSLRQTTFSRLEVAMSPAVSQFYKPTSTEIKLLSVPLYRRLLFSILFSLFIGFLGAFSYGYAPTFMEAIKPKET